MQHDRIDLCRGRTRNRGGAYSHYNDEGETKDAHAASVFRGITGIAFVATGKRRAMPRMVVLVIDSGGVGALPDADAYGDSANVNTIGNVAAQCRRLASSDIRATRSRRSHEDRGRRQKFGAPKQPLRAYANGRAVKIRSRDTGRWSGSSPTFRFRHIRKDFREDVIERFTAITGKTPLGNKPASGTEIIAELGDEHVRSGRPILYTSADSVFQVAAHEEVIPLSTLYDWCERARTMLVPPNNVNRVIARPFRRHLR